MQKAKRRTSARSKKAARDTNSGGQSEGVVATAQSKECPALWDWVKKFTREVRDFLAPAIGHVCLVGVTVEVEADIPTEAEREFEEAVIGEFGSIAAFTELKLGEVVKRLSHKCKDALAVAVSIYAAGVQLGKWVMNTLKGSPVDGSLEFAQWRLEQQLVTAHIA